MNPAGALILAMLMAVVLFAPRRVALLGMLAGAMYLPQAQQLDVFGFNLWGIRFLELAGFYRVMSRGEFSFRQLNRIDRAFFWLYGFTITVFVLRSTEGVANQIGMAVDAFLCYVIFRGLVGGVDDFRQFLRTFVILLAPYVLLVVIESKTGHNPFEFLGGITGGANWARHGRPRCFGSFRQPDTLGMFGASFLPLFVGLACIPRERKRAFAGIVLCIILAWASNSGGAISGAAAGLVFWGLWRFRTEMRKVRWGIVALLVALALVMKSPIWYIFNRVSGITGGDGWTRSYLIEMAYRHLDLWWLAGMPITATKGWFPFTLATTGGADITDQYISFGLTAGFWAIVLFIVLLTRAFSYLGKSLAIVRSSSLEKDGFEFLFWGMGVMLVVHIINWFGITYFDQMFMIWFMQIAAISSVSESCMHLQSKTDEIAELPNEMEAIHPPEQFQPKFAQKS
jgi:hypothetical protein